MPFFQSCCVLIDAHAGFIELGPANRAVGDHRVDAMMRMRWGWWRNGEIAGCRIPLARADMVIVVKNTAGLEEGHFAEEVQVADLLVAMN